MAMHKIPFFIGTFISYFVPGRKNRRRVGGWINMFFFYIPIRLFIKRTYGVRVKTMRFVRQISMKRMTCVVNDRYFVKVFRFVPVKRLNEYKFLLDFIRPHLPVKIPKIFVAQRIPMYVADKLPGRVMVDFDKQVIMKSEKKIKKKVSEIITALKSIRVDSIPDNERFVYPIQVRRVGKGIAKNSVLAHCDLNPTNLLLDSNLKIVSIIDWDSMAIVPDVNKDENGFANLWEKYKKSV